MGRDTLFAALESQMFGRRCLYRYTVTLQTHRRCQCLAHGIDVGAEFGPLHRYGAVDVRYSVSVFLDKICHPTQQYLRVYASKLLRRIGKELPYIACGQCPEKGITDGVYGHIAVRVSYTSLRMLYLHASEYESQPPGQRMHVISVSYSYIIHRFRDCFACTDVS